MRACIIAFFFSLRSPVLIDELNLFLRSVVRVTIVDHNVETVWNHRINNKIFYFPTIYVVKYNNVMLTDRRDEFKQNDSN